MTAKQCVVLVGDGEPVWQSDDGCLLGPRVQGRDRVAQALGFFDGANFRRSFKRWTGMSPGGWLTRP